MRQRSSGGRRTSMARARGGRAAERVDTAAARRHGAHPRAALGRQPHRTADTDDEGARTASPAPRRDHESRVRAVRRQGRAGGADLLRPVHRLRLSRDLHLRGHLLRRVAVDHRVEQPEGAPALRGRGGRRCDGLGRSRVCVSERRGLGGFWLVFATGTAVAAWINFGTPRISYGGYQTGLAFYKATLQNLGPAVSATVVRDRLIGVAFGLAVFGLLEHVLWPVRAADRMHARLADVFRSLAAFARVASRPRDDGADADSWRQLISQQVTDV